MLQIKVNELLIAFILGYLAGTIPFVALAAIMLVRFSITMVDRVLFAELDKEEPDVTDEP